MGRGMKMAKAQRAYDDAKAELDAAQAALTGAEGRQSRFSGLRRDARDKLRELEANPPDAQPDSGVEMSK